MMDWTAQPEAWVALLTLTILEIVLGIDNIIFISILADRVEEARRPAARQVGLALAMLTRIALLFSLVWIMRLTEPFMSVFDHPVSGRDLILLAGGMFLLWKSTREIHHKLEGDDEGARSAQAASFLSVVVQIALLDIVFSLDSVITAVGVADDLAVMVIAVVLAVGFMMAAASSVSAFVNRHPTVKMLALSFLLLIGMSLIAEGMGHHVPKPYIYFAMGFSIFVEVLNLAAHKSSTPPVHLRRRRADDPPLEDAGG